MTEPTNTDADMAEEMARLSAAMETLSNHRFVRIHNSTWRMLGLQFIRGLALGLGTVLGASVLVSLVVLTLSQVSFIPVIGSWATQIIEEIQSAPN